MKPCVIFNPAARGQKAERLRAQLNAIAQHAVLKQTAAAGDARRLAREAIAEGCDTIVGAGGDGTVNEVLNGIGDAKAFDRVRLGVLPLGTVNVFALEMKIPFHAGKAWDLILAGRETKIDLGWAEFSEGGPAQRRYFMQLAGAGLDARAIELVDWQQKKKIGPLAYVIAGLKALREPQPKITVTASSHGLTGESALIGNGGHYGGRYNIFPGSSMRDGLLDVVVFPRVSWWRLLRCAGSLLALGRPPESLLRRLRTATLTVSAEPAAAFEVDGEWAGNLPATFGVERERLRVIVPQGRDDL